MDPQKLTVGVLRELFRNLQLWESLWETDHIDVLRGPNGVEYQLHDIQYLYECRSMLSPRQMEAIEMCLYRDIREKDVSLLMGVSPTNPVAMYATNGLERILAMMNAGKLPRFQVEQTKNEDTEVQ
ncbi:hypothetical protein [Dermacoccus nishinomiyaensis]|uniref:hypothetical protein n=1 Tax=Dermacoccus nishinomiyaensis TaxID=1274 RepID=UPI00248F0BEC|nr:hypothetical protein [Dermacoccus nishinomiyaensis]